MPNSWSTLFKRALADTDRNHRLAMLLIISEILHPYYVRFCRDEKIVDSPLPRKALDLAWEFIVNGTSIDGNMPDPELLFELAPDTEDYGSVFTSRALDFCSCAGYLAQSIIDSSASVPIETLVLLDEIGNDLDETISEYWHKSEKQSTFFSQLFKLMTILLIEVPFFRDEKPTRVLRMIFEFLRSADWQRGAYQDYPTE